MVRAHAVPMAIAALVALACRRVQLVGGPDHDYD